ncbi:MAG TPA: ParB/RepB/Spo0J family partition protein [Sphingomonas sp.]|jgi:ParB/RepB/Spo0J family partition protein
MSSIKSVTAETMTIDQLDVSPLNVRRHRADIEELGPMEASILGRGLIQPLNVHPMLGSKKSGAFAGGRRYRAIRNLIGRGDLPADWPVRVELYRGYSDVEILELSLGENIQRRDLQDYEICAAVARLSARGESAEAIATALGQPLDRVRRQMRVGQLAPPIFEALVQTAITIEAARAYAATADQQLQLVVYEEVLRLPDYQRTPDRIRAAMKVGDRAAAKLLRLVTADTYRAAGGRFELDLFAGEAEERGRIVDEGLLRQLADARLAHVRDETRVMTERRDLRFVAKPPPGQYGGADETLRVNAKRRDGGGLILPDGDVVAWIDLNEAGEPQVSYWWESRKAKSAGALRGTTAVARSDRAGPVPTGTRAIADPYTYAGPAKAAIKEEHGASADALIAIRSIRRELLRALMIEDAQRGGEVGFAFAIWGMLRDLLTRDSHVGLRAPSPSDHEAGISTDATVLAREHVEQHVAHNIWLGAVREVSAESYITEPDLAAAFVHFLNAGSAKHRLAGAVLAGLVLERSAAAPGYDMPAHTALAQMTRGSDAMLRKLWSPTAEFIGLFPKAQQLAFVEPLVDAGSLAKWTKAKAADVPALVAQALAGGGHAVPGRSRSAATEWVHPLLAFAPLDFSRSAPSTAATLEEAA